ncbi:small secreted protein [Streptacidiphilus sp. N1-12]|uniref:Small secreted protein n=2 Tax=Streptacidiphilus alkalitolerans TaxID=3342712 RepID=A0ABV6WFK7_9ACTN
MVTKIWLRLAAPAALVALGVTGCGSGNGPAVEAWAKSVCQGMQSPVQQANAALADTGAVKPGETPKALQTRLAADFGALATANTQIAQAVQKAGAPKVANGAETQADALSELDQAAGGYTKVQQSVQALSVTDQAKFAASLKGVGDQVQQLAELSTSALQKLQTGDLGAALAKQPGCKSVSATTSATAPAETETGTATTAATAGSTGATTTAGATATATGGAAATATATKKPSATPSATASAH